jgi:3-hydroxyisobutyrate dehydrogenase-like beta-hydroxyacid dehydrogenase
MPNLREVRPPIVALLGLGEAGAAIASDLVAQGVVARGWDPDPARRVAGVERAASAREAVEGADVVLSINAQAAAVPAALSVVGALTTDHLFADLNTTSAEVKRQVAAAIVPSGAAFVDVALLAPVPGTGVRTPCLASGAGAERFAEIFGVFGMPVEVLSDVPGEAATRKLLRSVFMKGLAAAIIESLSAAELAGCEPWARAQIVSVLTGADESLVDRLVHGSKQHARRRVDEMDAAAAVVADLGLEPHVALAAAAVLRSLAE